MNKTILTTAIAALVLSGCGSTPQERGASGAGLGAGAGAVIGAVTGVGVVHSAVIGALAGGLTGAVTTKDQINMGEPAWKRGQTAQPVATAAAAPARIAGGDSTVRDIQAALAHSGYYGGPVDGISGPKTQAAIRAYQKQHGLLVDGRPTPELLSHMAGGAS